jgi:hypothetical protein
MAARLRAAWARPALATAWRPGPDGAWPRTAPGGAQAAWVRPASPCAGNSPAARDTDPAARRRSQPGRNPLVARARGPGAQALRGSAGSGPAARAHDRPQHTERRWRRCGHPDPGAGPA